MPTLRLTDICVANLRPASPQVTYWDTVLPTFGVRVGLRTKTFVLLRGRQRRRETIGHYPAISLAEARRRARAMLENPVAGSSVITAEAVPQFLATISVRARTHREYTRRLNRHLIPSLGHKELCEITARDIIAVTDRLKATPAERRHAHVVMQTFFNDCVRRTLLSTSPMQQLRNPVKPRQRTRVLSIDEIRAVWNTDTALTPIIRLCILTLMRRSEAAAVQPSWIRADSLVIPASVAKNGREHTLPMTPAVRSALSNVPYPPFNWARMKQIVDQQSGVTDWVLHDLRRSGASIMAARPIGAPPHLIERILNHITGAGTSLSLIYNQHKYADEIRDLLTHYHDHLINVLLSPGCHTTGNTMPSAAVPHDNE